ncbi:hypothetical protein CH299_13450 [Rhodococcus sp. 14-2686-1-2]|nr:hypothetical protein CH301_12770 [Rhodococcus sp. 15-1189-1-1a]OZF14427.1 hypothetical protein CH299_13450 [Rhodococcus sp. 14-2686-1-2]
MISMTNSVTDTTDTKTEPLSVKKLLGGRAVRYTYDELRDHLYNLLGFMFEGAALKRLYKVANTRYDDIAAQNAALQDAAQAELVKRPATTSPARKNILAFQKDMDPLLEVKAGAPNPYLEENRPHWSSRASDQNVRNIGDKTASIHEMSWRSQPIVMPLTNTWYGAWRSDGSFKTATIMADIRQNVDETAPRIAFERQGFTERDGKVVNLDGKDYYTLTLDEAANLARGLLLLIDLATEGTNEIGRA